MNGILVSTAANALATTTRDADTRTLFNDIRAGKWRESVEHIRVEYSLAVSEGRDPKAAVAGLKKKLLGVMWSGRFKNRKQPVAEKLLAYSGLLCADLDDLGERLTEVRTKLIGFSSYLLGLFISPTGSGLKAIFRVSADAMKHAANFHAVKLHVHALTSIEIDGACKDVSRLCFVSYDPDLWINPDETLPIEPSEGPELGINDTPSLPVRLTSESCISASLRDCIPASLHNKADSILENIKARREAVNSLTSKHPNLVNLYTHLIEPRYQAQAHARNNFITQSVPFLYRAVASQFVLELVGHFYDCNRALFNDPRDQHMKESKTMLESVAKTYLESLNAVERPIYDALPEQQQETFRICRDLALLPEPEREPLTFFLSFNHLADRLGIFPTQAQRIMRELEGCGLVKLLKKGTRRAAGVRGEAGSYQWLIAP